MPMYHQQGTPFPNMLSVQSLCSNSIDQRVNYICSMHEIVHYELHMVNLIHKLLSRQPTFDDALLMRISNSIIPQCNASNNYTNHLGNDISAAVPTVLVVPRGGIFVKVNDDYVDGFVRYFFIGLDSSDT